MGIETRKERDPDRLSANDYSKTDNVRLSQESFPARAGGDEKAGEKKPGEVPRSPLSELDQPDRAKLREGTQEELKKKTADVPPMKKLRDDV